MFRSLKMRLMCGITAAAVLLGGFAFPVSAWADDDDDFLAVPNTGGLFGALNISKTDYLITGVIVFLLTGIFGAVFIAKRQKKISRRR